MIEGVIESTGVSQRSAEKLLSDKRIVVLSEHKTIKIKFEDILMRVNPDSTYFLVQGWKQV
jgi:hypothetical protein